MGNTFVLKKNIAIIIAIVLHSVGLAGILFFKSDLIIRCTPITLLLCFVLLLWTQRKITAAFIFFVIIVCAGGFFIEVAGVKTGWLFGKYTYGKVLGPRVLDVPVIIGVNWFIVTYCCGITGRLFIERMERANMISINRRVFLLPVAGAAIAALFDWLMEPVAIMLGFWQWENNEVPLYNYFCWFIASMIFLSGFEKRDFDKQNKFAPVLLLIQSLFFLILGFCLVYFNNTG
ncbi:MAG: carotenoid biosynthesis protein [Ferruginibacter sp.]